MVQKLSLHGFSHCEKTQSLILDILSVPLSQKLLVKIIRLNTASFSLGLKGVPPSGVFHLTEGIA